MQSVMLVDDDAPIHSLVAAVLGRRGYTMLSARSGAECLRYAREGFRGVILMDVRMPGLSGWDTIRALRAEALLDGSVICMLTGMPAPGAGIDGGCTEVLDYLSKPFHPARLLDIVEGAMALLAM